MSEKIDDVIRERQKIADQLFESENDKRELEKFDERMNILYRKNQQFFFEVESMYSTGELNYLSMDLTQELNHSRQQVFSAIEDQKEHIDKERRNLEDKESDLYYKQLKLSEEEM
ncbi:DUF3958 domain-containing protein [Erwinia sp. CPCC 100877]|nr:DUF3958 domain-containing protein [Erwinia sp. CPCC 100877]